jgi:DNA-binding CsgD family transcriptional regulator
MAIVDATSRRYVETNQAFDDLFVAPGKTMTGELFETLIPRDQRERVLQDYDAVATGRLSGYQAQRYLIIPGGKVSGEIWVRRLDLEDSRQLTTAIFLPSGQDALPESQLAMFGEESSDIAFLVTDHDWTVEYASLESERVLGGESGQLVGKPLLGAIHPAVASDFLLSVTRATATRRPVMARAQLRVDSDWRHCVCLITTLCNDSPPRLGLAIIALGIDSREAEPSRTSQLERHMWRITSEVLAARFLPKVADTLAIDRAGELAELTSAQFEITMRLVNGERVSEISKAMHISPSTVRNQLTAVYRRFGVHSQGELISVLRESMRRK